MSVRNEGFSKILDAVKSVANGFPLPRSPQHGQPFLGGYAQPGRASSVAGDDFGVSVAGLAQHKPSIEERIYEENLSLHEQLATMQSRLAAIFTMLDYYDSQQ